MLLEDPRKGLMVKFVERGPQGSVGAPLLVDPQEPASGKERKRIHGAPAGASGGGGSGSVFDGAGGTGLDSSSPLGAAGAVESRKDALVSGWFWMLRTRAYEDRKNRKHWERREIWLGETSRLYFRAENREVTPLFGGKPVTRMEVRALDQKATCFPFALALGVPELNVFPIVVGTEDGLLMERLVETIRDVMASDTHVIMTKAAEGKAIIDRESLVRQGSLSSLEPAVAGKWEKGHVSVEEYSLRGSAEELTSGIEFEPLPSQLARGSLSTTVSRGDVVPRI